MNLKGMSKYLYVYKTQIIRCFTYKFEVYGNILMQSIIMVTSAFFCRALYGEGGSVKGVDVDSMLTELSEKKKILDVSIEEAGIDDIIRIAYGQ